MAEHSDQELFVHASAFPRDGRPPAIGELLSFELELAPDGRKRAVRVRRLGVAGAASGAGQLRHGSGRTAQRADSSSSFGTRFVALLVVAGLGWYTYGQYAQRAKASLAPPQTVASPAPTAAPQIRPPAFQCDGRKHCSQMSSCSEAKLFLKNCPGMEMDGDGDGVPCEQQWCVGN